MNDCNFLQTEDITSYHGDVFDHPLYRYTCKKRKKSVIPCVQCNEKKCKDYCKNKD